MPLAAARWNAPKLRIRVHTRVRAACDPGGEVALRTAAQRFDEIILGRFGDQLGHEFLRGFEQQPGRRSVRIMDDAAAFRRFGFIRDARKREGARVGDAEMTRRIGDDDRMIGRDGIEIVAGRMPPLGE